MLQWGFNHQDVLCGLDLAGLEYVTGNKITYKIFPEGINEFHLSPLTCARGSKKKERVDK
jgi:hypothetical protein